MRLQNRGGLVSERYIATSFMYARGRERTVLCFGVARRPQRNSGRRVAIGSSSSNSNSSSSSDLQSIAHTHANESREAAGGRLLRGPPCHNLKLCHRGAEECFGTRAVHDRGCGSLSDSGHRWPVAPPPSPPGWTGMISSSQYFVYFVPWLGGGPCVYHR